MADSGALMLSRSTDARMSSMSILGLCAVAVISAVAPALVVLRGGRDRRIAGGAEKSGVEWNHMMQYTSCILVVTCILYS